MTTPKHHQSLAPSSLSALEECACYVSDSRETPWSESGTDQHAVLAKMLAGDDSGLAALEIEAREGVHWAAAYILGYAKKELRIEQRMSLRDDNFNEITFGTADAFCPYEKGDGVDVFDYKSGQLGNYEAQVSAYALMAMKASGVHTATTHVLFGRFQKTFRFQITREEAQARLDGLISRVNQLGKTPEPCKYCDWCANALTCSALYERAEAVRAGREDWALEQYHVSNITDPAEMAKALKLAKAMTAWVAAVTFHAKDMASKGQMPPGFKWQDRQGARFVTDILVAYDALGLPKDKFMPLCSVAIGEIEKVFAETFKLTLAKAKRDVAVKLEPCTRRGSPSKTLVAEKE